MPPETGIVTAIDVGTTKVCTIVARKNGSKGIDVLGYGTVPCDGLRKGNVTDVAATERAVRASVMKAERKTGHRIESVFVGVTGSHVSFENRNDRLDFAGEKDVITARDLTMTPQSLAGSLDTPGRKLIHAIRMSYSVDGEAGIRNPVGMHSAEVEMETHLVMGGSRFLDRLVQAVEAAGVSVTSLVLEPLASGLAVLTPEEKERGTLLVDMGGGTTDVVGFQKGRVCYAGVIPVGGYQFTNDIAVTFNTSYEAAEQVKLAHASTEVQASDAKEEISIPVVGRDMELKVRRMEICQLARERAQELARMIKIKLEDELAGESIADRLVLTGGASNMPGLADLMQRTLTIPVRSGLPNVSGSMPDEIRDPAYATSIGMLDWAVHEYVPPTGQAHANNKQGTEAVVRGFWSDLATRFSRIMPVALVVIRKGRTRWS